MMEDKDFKEKIREAMIEETKDIEMSKDLIDRIMSKRKKTWRQKLNQFLNKEIELPLFPVLVGVTALFIVSIIPRDIFSQPSRKTIDIGPSRIIIRDISEVGYNEN